MSKAENLSQMSGGEGTAVAGDARVEHQRQWPIPRVDPPKSVDLSRNREENVKGLNLNGETIVF